MLYDPFYELFICQLTVAWFSFKPFVVSRACDMNSITKPLDGILIHFIHIFDCKILCFIMYSAYQSPPSNSFSFFNSFISISLSFSFAWSILFSIRRRSVSVSLSSDFALPRRSVSPSTPFLHIFVPKNRSAGKIHRISP